MSVLESAAVASREDVKIEIDSPYFRARVLEENEESLYDEDNDENGDAMSTTSSSTKIEEDYIALVEFRTS